MGTRITSVGILAVTYPAASEILTQGMPVTAGMTYTLSAYMRPTANRDMNCVIIWYNNTGGVISNPGSEVISGAANTWQRVSLTALAPAGAVFARVNLRILDANINETGFVDAVLFEQTSQLRPYFDGNTYDGTGGATVTTTWDGTANNSTSRANILTSIPTLDAPLAVNVDVQPVTIRYPLANALPFSAITREIGTEQLYTSIAVEYLGGTAIADNLSAQEQYGIEVLNWKTLLSTEAAAEGLAEYWSRKYSEPTTRLDGVEIVVNGLSPVQRGQVFGLELGDLVTVRWTPNGIGNPLEQAATVESIEHTITPGEHRLRLGLISGLSGFIINQSLLGQEGVGF
jgi:hypothetical protein